MNCEVICEKTPMTLSYADGSWKVTPTVCRLAPGLLEFRYVFSSEVAAPLPKMTFAWTLPCVDVTGRWYPGVTRNVMLPPNWGWETMSELGIGAPVVSLFNQTGENRGTFAFSDAMNSVWIKCGVNELAKRLACQFELFRVPGAPTTSYSCSLRLDLRAQRYEACLKGISGWWESMPAYTPCHIPELSRCPVYSSWYVFHQDLHDDEVEAECALAPQYGMKSVIVDDGWQTEDTHCGYAFCGDWEVCGKFPDMAAHVARVHELGMKYVLWYSMPFVGIKSKNYARFQGKYLYLSERLQAAVLDPRFADVREFLIDIYVTAMKSWGLDGFKLDFIDRFCFEGADPAVAENYAGRDCLTLAEGVDRLLVGTMERLRQLNPEVLIEFRQRYIGPSMRKYGNMFRAADCPNDYVTNRVRTLDVRMLAGRTPVHSDMLMWDLTEPVASAARQLSSIMFSVPQISVRLSKLSQEHREMLAFYLRLWQENRDLLLDGDLRCEHPELCYPQVSSRLGARQFTAVYSGGQVVAHEGTSGSELMVMNASGEDQVILDLGAVPSQVQCFDCMGHALPEVAVSGSGLQRVLVPDSGVLRLRF